MSAVDNVSKQLVINHKFDLQDSPFEIIIEGVLWWQHKVIN